MEQETNIQDVLSSLEAKIDALLSISRIQDLTIKILSNKINDLILQNKTTTQKPQPSIEAVYNSAPKPNENQVPISSDFNLEVEKSPNGFRRTSRPETFAPEQYVQEKVPEKKPIPKAEVIVPKVKPQIKKEVKQDETQFIDAASVIPILQRVVDSTGKSVFLADVEITNLQTDIVVAKTRTQGNGKWSSSLPVGKYKVVIRKSAAKDKVEVVQEITVDGSQQRIDLQTLILKV